MRSCTYFPHVGKCQRSTNIHFNEVIICPGRIRIRYEKVTYDVAGAELTFCYVNYIYYHMLIEKMSDNNEDHTSRMLIYNNAVEHQQYPSLSLELTFEHTF